MNLSKETYKKYAAARAPKSPILKNCLRAFLTGGLICTLGQGLNTLYTKVCGLEKPDAGTLTACTLVLIAAVLTGTDKGGLIDTAGLDRLHQPFHFRIIPDTERMVFERM